MATTVSISIVTRSRSLSFDATMSMGFLSFLLPLLTTFLLISHFPIYCRARRAFYIIAYEAFQSDCAFDLGGYSFDLCPLAGTAAATTTKYGRGHLRKNEEINPTPVEGPSSGMRVYEVSLGLSSNPTVPITGIL